MRNLKWGKLVLYVSGGGLSAVFGILAVFDPKDSVKWIGIGTAIVSVAGAIGALWPQPPNSIPESTPITTASGTPTGETVKSVAANAASQKGSP